MNKVEDITPYGDRRDKSEQVRDMFDNIAPSYDAMNRFMSLGNDRGWRRRCVRMVSDYRPSAILDIATGTADLAIALAKANPGADVTGVDLSEAMLEVGRRKVSANRLGTQVELLQADALDLPFADGSFDAITIAFGVRNFQNLERGYSEMHRVLRKGGRLYVLELSPPSSPLVRPFYGLYTRAVIPAVGRLVSKDRRAYAYLPESIAAVPARDSMTAIITDAGFADASWRNLTLGTAVIYTATKE